ncbi:putative bifunctional diguanylate cyclase/phosphodiesterase [Allohahella marinimesophila]|uniref:putative bifunctional diguanylate cyclase/phosphodiesterase n=1 Tax=Allohahella marinimesophila TaxID=1054972 RepID=UPI0031D72C3D
MNATRYSALIEAQQEVIEKIALGNDLSSCLDLICNRIEAIIDSPLVRSSIMILSGDKLSHAAAPSLPATYCSAVDNLPIGPDMGSCGTAAYTGQQVIVSDIDHDPLWKDFREVALEHGLHACWSTPIRASDNTIIGSFGIYYLEPKQPEAFHLELIKRFSCLSSLAIETDSSRQREAQLHNELQCTKDKLEAFIEVMPDVALILDLHGKCVDIYGTDTHLLIRPPQEMINHAIQDLLPADIARRFMSVVERAVNLDEVQFFEYSLPGQHEVCVFEARVVRLEGYLDERPALPHVLWLARDITARKKAEDQIEQLAFYDPLTALPNRRLLKDRLQTAIDRAERHQQCSALLFLDLDDFKRINDSLGHAVGDKLLCTVVSRLKALLREADTLARLGGDEFIVMPDLSHDSLIEVADEVSRLATKILGAFREAFELEGNLYRIGISIGISLIDDGKKTADEVIRQADTAMYQAKKLGGSCMAFFEPELQTAADERMQLERELGSGIAEGQFVAYFQPQFDCAGALIGAEALIRWQHPTRGLVLPDEFIPFAAQSDCINQLHALMLAQVCEVLVKIGNFDTLPSGFSIAVNICPRQFRDHKLESHLDSVLSAYGISPHLIKLEITENLLMDTLQDAAAQLSRLRELGFRVSLDDFGTGYSSLSYLQNIPVDELKIDKTFIHAMHSGTGGTAIVDAVIALANLLGFGVIAEGVESEDQLKLLHDKPISGLQGYQTCRPLPADAFLSSIANSQPTPEPA